MGASVRIEDEAFADERYEDLAVFAGLADADCARGKMARLWRQCTIEQTPYLDNQMVCRVLGPNGVDALVRARLGESLIGERVRIRGTRGRIEWLTKLRANGRKGGRPKGRTPKPSGSGGGNPSGSQELNPPAPAPAPAPAPIRGIDSLVVPSEPTAKPRPHGLHQLPDDWSPRSAENSWAQKHGISADREAFKFRNHHTAKGSKFKNWDAAFRTWLGNAAEWNRSGPTSSPASLLKFAPPPSDDIEPEIFTGNFAKVKP